jgi:hypothetical protein
MDFPTRDRYRHVIEEIARSSRYSESQVASQAIQLASEGAVRKGGGDRTAHVGFYLIDKGLAQLEGTAELRRSPFEALRRVSRRFPLLLYVGTIMLVTAIFYRYLPGEGAGRWAIRLDTRADRDPLPLGSQSSGDSPGKLAGDVAGDAAAAAAPGLLRRNSAGI